MSHDLVQLKKDVFESLDNAVTNGYEFLSDPADQIADDLKEYDATFEEVETSVYLPFVKEWLDAKKR